MNHSKRGLALIFNHEFFTVSHLKPRCGTNVDCENLKATLKDLGFEVNDYHNLTQKDIVKQLERGKLHFEKHVHIHHSFKKLIVFKKYLYIYIDYKYLYLRNIYIFKNVEKPY